VNVSPEETAQLLRKLDGYLEAEGRSRDELKIVVGAVNDRIKPDMIAKYAEAGVTEVLIPFLRQGKRHLNENLENVTPYLETAARL
jgi:alkanesulfonate monooxygenase SsuD/methylene tetrahydromethanopterin reductase-like flavin-dependent oxidoreductase (luciferase family)